MGDGANAPADRNGDFEIGPDYGRPLETRAVEGRPRGTVRQFMMDSEDSKLYPGIARDGIGAVDPGNPRTLLVKTHAEPWRRAITVYVPAQYKRGTDAPFIVVNDGPKLGDPDMLLPHVLDNLIAEHRVPAMIAVMIQNGGGDAQGSERGLEYDTLSGRYAEFVEHEVLPQVESRYHVELTHDPDGRAAMGCSSGAAAAFTMAWFHPEWYHRVISYSGTFVNQQWPFNAANPGGAWDYHETIIPDARRKPIRVWLEVGDRDLLNPNVMRDGMHDWVAANHRMAAVLEEKGYQYQYVFALDAGHCERKVREQTLPEALQWAWRGYQAVRGTGPATRGSGTGAAAPARPPITGLSHIAIYASQPAKSEYFYVHDLGAVEGVDVEHAAGARYYFAPTQFVEVLPLPPHWTSLSRLDHVAFDTTDAAALRRYLRSRGIAAPARLRYGSDGSAWFDVKDPEGNDIQFVQPPTHPPTIPVNPLSRHMIHAGFIIHDRALEDTFYRGMLGFRPYWYGGMTDTKPAWISEQVPDGTDWLEYMLVGTPRGRGIPPGMKKSDVGVLDHFSLGVRNVEAAYTLLWNDGRLEGQDDLPKIGRDAKWQLNLFDPDGTRVEIMELHAVGKPCCSPFTASDPMY